MPARPSLPPVDDKPPVKLDPGHRVSTVAADALLAASRPAPQGIAPGTGLGGPLASGPLLAATF